MFHTFVLPVSLRNFSGFKIILDILLTYSSGYHFFSDLDYLNLLIAYIIGVFVLSVAYMAIIVFLVL